MNERVDGRPGVLIRGDAREVHLDELLRREQPRLQRAVDLFDGRLDQVEHGRAGAGAGLRRDGTGNRNRDQRQQCCQRNDDPLHNGPPMLKGDVRERHHRALAANDQSALHGE